MTYTVRNTETFPLTQRGIYEFADRVKSDRVYNFFSDEVFQTFSITVSFPDDNRMTELTMWFDSLDSERFDNIFSFIMNVIRIHKECFYDSQSDVVVELKGYMPDCERLFRRDEQVAYIYKLEKQ